MWCAWRGGNERDNGENGRQYVRQNGPGATPQSAVARAWPPLRRFGPGAICGGSALFAPRPARPRAAHAPGPARPGPARPGPAQFPGPRGRRVRFQTFRRLLLRPRGVDQLLVFDHLRLTGQREVALRDASALQRRIGNALRGDHVLSPRAEAGRKDGGFRESSGRSDSYKRSLGAGLHPRAGGWAAMLA